MEFLESHPRTLTALLALAMIIITATSFYRAVSSRHFGLSESAAIQTAEMLSRQKAHEAAIRLLARYREQHPGRPQVELHYGNALLRAQRAREAEAIYRLLPDSPELDGLGLNHALALFQMGEYERAREAYIRAAQCAKDMEDTIVERRAREAVEHLDELLGHKPLFMPSESPSGA
jgi:tetratricopeptide (TPR) repeat protein